MERWKKMKKGIQNERRGKKEKIRNKRKKVR